MLNKSSLSVLTATACTLSLALATYAGPIAAPQRGTPGLIPDNLGAPPALPAPHGIALGPDGKPVPGAEITVMGNNMFFQTVRADERGSFTFGPPAIEPDNYIIARSGNLATSAPVACGGQNEFTLHLTPGVLCDIQGQVEDQDAKPLANAPVTLIRDSSNGIVELDHKQTGVDGRFTFPNNFGDVHYSLRVDAAGYTTGYSEFFKTKTGQNFQTPCIFVKKTDSFVGGTVVDADGKPVEGVTITGQESKDVRTKTDKLGHFLLQGVPSGETSVLVQTADGEGFQAILRGGTIDKVIQVSAPVTGVVVDETGKPVAGAEVLVCMNGDLKDVYSDDIGHFKVQSPQLKTGSTFMVRTTDRGTVQPVIYKGESQLTINIKPGVLSTVSGRITSSGGTPISNASVSLILLNGNSTDNFEQTQTDAQGAYSLPRAFANQQYFVTAEAPGFASGNSDTKVVGSGQTFNFPPLALRPADNFVGGTLVDSMGNPVANATVHDGNVGNLETTTDKAGHFMLKGVPSGKTSVWANGPDGAYVCNDLLSGRGDNILYLPKLPGAK